MNETLDDRTTAYILDTRPPFEDLRQVAAQLAGLLVLAASGASDASDRVTLSAARETLDRAKDGIRCARPSARCRRHHGCLLAAVAALDDALHAASTRLRTDGSAWVDAVLTPLKEGYGELQAAADRLPGFELIDFNHGCCVTGHVGPVGP